MTNDPKLYLTHIFESINWIENYLKDVSEKDFYASKQVQDAVVRQLEIIGEATKNISDDFKKLHPEVPWKKMTGMRDVLIHGYFDVDIDLVYDTAHDQIPKLKKQIAKLLGKVG